MWFDEIMEDCKAALAASNKHKDIFVPIFLKLALAIALGIYIFISFIAGIIQHEYILEYIFTDSSAFMEILPTLAINGIIIYLLILLGFSLIDVGSINMYKAALEDRKPKFRDFTEGIKNYFSKVVLGKLFLHLLFLITMPLLLVLYLLYAMIVGTLTAGWGILFLAVFVSVYLGTWITIIVIDGYTPLKAIGRSLKLGRRNFKPLFVVLLASTLLASYCVSIFGILAAVLAGWLIAGIVHTIFKLVVMRVYYRNRETL